MKHKNMKYVLTFLILLISSVTTSSVIGCLDEDIYLSRSVVYDTKYCYQDYMDKMAYLESRGDYDVVNRFGYMGKYQFGSQTLKSLVKKGYLNASKNEIKRKNFIKNRELQERAMMALTEHNIQVLSNYKLLQYEDTVIDGVKVTLEGMLAAAHLRGPNAVKRFVRSNGRINLTDGNGTSVKDYIKQFENV